MQTVIEEILSKVDLLSLIERAGGKPKRVGNGWRSTCPLHGGTNPTSLYISHGHGKQVWYCFADCNTGGDAIDFVQRWLGYDFLDAVRYLADQAGMSLRIDETNTQRLAQERAARRRIEDVLALAADYYRRTLGDEARAYLRRRGLEAAIAGGYVGYADGRLCEYIRTSVEMTAALEAGVVRMLDDERIVDAIPAGYLVYIHCDGERVVYLSGRAVATDDPKKKARNIKAPRRPFWARQRGSRPLIVVEGQADALTAWLWGYHAVALCGLSLDEADANRIRRHSAVYLSLDADSSGTERLAAIGNTLGPLTMVLPPLPDGHKDLNEWLQAGGTAEQFAALLEQATPWIDMAIDRASKAPAYKLATHLENLAHLVNALPEALRGRYVAKICDSRRLTTRSDFRRLLAARNGHESSGFEIVDGRLVYHGEPLANFAARITHELYYYDGEQTKVFLTLEGELETGDRLEPIEIPAEEFAGMRWVEKYWGARPILYTSPGKAYILRRAIQEVSKRDMTRERVYVHTGWAEIEKEKRYFLTTSGGIGSDGLRTDIRVDLGVNNMSRYELPPVPADPREAIMASLNFLKVAPHRVTVPLWAAMYAAPLSPIKTLNAVIWVYGTTQSGKSTITHLALAHFGPTFIQGHEYRAPKDWTSTVTDLEGAMFTVKDAPIVIDDYAPAHSGAAEARELAKKAHYVVRSVGNRSSRGRRRVDLSEQTQRPPRSLVIATAEQPLIGQSIVGRMIYVAVEPGDVIRREEESLLDLAQRQAEAGLYAQAMASYIAWLARNWDAVIDSMMQKVSDYSSQARKLIPAGQARLADYYAILMSAIDIALMWAEEAGAISDDEAFVLSMDCAGAILEVLRDQGDRVAAESPVVKFWTAVADLIAQEKVYFEPRLKPVGWFPPDRAERIGWYDGEHVYLLTNAALAHVKAYWQALDERFDTLADALRRQLWQQGYVVERDKRQMERLKKFDGQPVRVLVVDRRRVEEADVILERQQSDQVEG